MRQQPRRNLFDEFAKTSASRLGILLYGEWLSSYLHEILWVEEKQPLHPLKLSMGGRPVGRWKSNVLRRRRSQRKVRRSVRSADLIIILTERVVFSSPRFV
mmetsp:Transcript_99318/g.286622  ORF Transcript_99318/g.286622 Transcript_99318/m.286622 type:complete len:101 (-) Transcript_99318:340-642(-)